MSEMHKNAPEILVIFFNAVVKRPNIFPVKKAQHFLFKLSAAFAGDDLDERNLLFDRFPNNAIEFAVDLVAAIVDVV